ncbi:hypothetical protein [Enterobacter hormaechei]
MIDCYFIIGRLFVVISKKIYIWITNLSSCIKLNTCSERM